MLVFQVDHFGRQARHNHNMSGSFQVHDQWLSQNVFRGTLNEALNVFHCVLDGAYYYWFRAMGDQMACNDQTF